MASFAFGSGKRDQAEVSFLTKAVQRGEVVGALLPYSGDLHPLLEWGLLVSASGGLAIGCGCVIAERRRN